MTTDLYSTELWLDGQAIELDKLNNGQRFLRAQLTDQVLEKLIPFLPVATGTLPSKQSELTGQGGANASTLYAYAMHPGSAYLVQGASNAEINIAAGTLLQKLGDANGQDSTLVPFSFDGTTSAFPAIANGATNYRIDLLQMALSYTTDTPLNVDFQDAVTRANTTVVGTVTKRRLKCVLSVKQGTPGASPVVPEPDAGAVPVGFVCVGASWTNVTAPVYGFEGMASPTTQAIVYDLRMPMGVRLHRVDPVLFKLQTAWALSNQNQTLTLSSSTNDMYCSINTGPGRLIGIMQESLGTAPTSIGLLRVGASTPSANYVAGNSLTSGENHNNGIIRWHRMDFETLHIPMGTGPTIQASVTNGYGPPLWSDGYRAPQEPVQGAGVASGATWGSVGVGYHNATSIVSATIGGIWFVLATGL
jgi:hypothetical protein